MRKRNLILGAGTVLGGAFLFTNLLRGPGDAATPTPPRVLDVGIVDRCGNVVREEDGREMVVQFRVDPPPIESAVHDPSVEQLPATEGNQVAVLLPADPRKASGVTLGCAYVNQGGGV